MNNTQTGTSTPRGYRPAIVALEDYGTLPAFLPESGETWNGFAMPIFDPAVITASRDTLANMFPADEESEDHLILRWNGDLPSIIDPQYEDDANYVEVIDIDGQTFLGIGNGAFVWSEVEA